MPSTIKERRWYQHATSASVYDPERWLRCPWLHGPAYVQAGVDNVGLSRAALRRIMER